MSANTWLFFWALFVGFCLGGLYLEWQRNRRK